MRRPLGALFPLTKLLSLYFALALLLSRFLLRSYFLRSKEWPSLTKCGQLISSLPTGSTSASPKPPWKVEFAVSIATIILGFWVPCSIYAAIDIFLPEFAARHKIQPDPKKSPDTGQIWLLIAHAFYVCILDLAGQALLTYLTGFRPLFTIEPTIPSGREFLVQWTYAMLAREVLAYYAHRAIHHPLLYARVHKKHHSFTAPIAFAALYTTITEHIVADVIPIVGPLALFTIYVQPVHILTFQGFLLSLFLVGTAEHSGFDFAQPAVSKFHDVHHEKFNLNYGTLHFMDWTHGTGEAGWNRRTAKEDRKRHRQTESQVGSGAALYLKSVEKP